VRPKYFDRKTVLTNEKITEPNRREQIDSPSAAREDGPVSGQAVQKPNMQRPLKKPA